MEQSAVRQELRVGTAYAGRVQADVPSPPPLAQLPALYWLPVDPEFEATLQALRRSDAGIEDTLPLLMRLANSRLDFVRTNKLDRVLQRYVARLQPEQLSGNRLRLALLSGNTMDHLLPSIRVAGLRRGLIVECYVGAYGQYRQELLDPRSELHGFAPGVVLFGLNAEALLPELPLTASLDEVEAEVVRAVDEMRSLWRQVRDGLGAVVLQQGLLDHSLPLFGGFETQVPAAPASVLRRCNRRLADAAMQDGALLLDLEWWGGQIGSRSLTDAMLWHQAKQEISPAVAPFYGELLGRQLAAVRGLSRKCLVLDLDNTLWGGVIGDDGLEGIVLGQGSALGEAFVAFQRYVKRLPERGILLAVSSKNEQAIAEAAFEQHPEMVLRRSDIVAFEANWNDKPSAVQRIAAELNIGLDSLVFFDDNPAERALMRQTLPAVAVPEVPEAVEAYGRCLADAGYFEAVAFTRDDAKRTEQYVANARRREVHSQAADMDAFLRDLDMELAVARFDRVNLRRVTQLINKTNQFNLTTRRYTEAEVLAMTDDPSVVALHARLKDRFGDNGIISIVIGRLFGDAERRILDIDTWLMSCRVLGRRVEQALLDVIVEAAAQAGAGAVYGRYVPTPKNAMVREHYPSLGFVPADDPEAAAGETCWRLDVAEYRPRHPEVLRVVMSNG